MEGIPLNTLITVGGVVFTIIAGWFAMKGTIAGVVIKVKSLTEDLHSALKQIKALWERKDASVEEMAEVKHELKYLSRDVEELREEAKYQRRKKD
jgi:chromosome segregation ATPase